MKIACYTRKSVYSDKSDSVDSQTRFCREYAEQNIDDEIESFTVYCDEGFTGANTSRPDFVRMMQDVDAGIVDILIVYQLDRLSRDVRDFSNIYKHLEEKGVKFVSVKEKIDTVSPIGKAMMYVTMVFAQMERETIAQRIGDNMISLARKGFWVCGPAPYGYVNKEITVNGKKHTTIVPDKEQAEHVANVFEEFLEGRHTLHSLYMKYYRKGEKGPAGFQYSTEGIYRILSKPCYAPTAPEMYDYFEGKGCQMANSRDDWDGTRAVMSYCRQKGGRNRPCSDWIISIGLHEPIVTADIWLRAQEQMHRNLSWKNGCHEPSLLKGVLRCKKCGRRMYTQRNKHRDGSPRPSYGCVTRKTRGNRFCDMKTTTCNVLDDKVMDILRQISVDNGAIKKYVSGLDEANSSERSVKELELMAEGIKKKIRRLSSALEDANGSTAVKYIIQQIEANDADLREVSDQIIAEKARAASRSRITEGVEEKCKKIRKMIEGLDGFSAKERNEIIRDVISSIYWDGETLEIKF